MVIDRVTCSKCGGWIEIDIITGEGHCDTCDIILDDYGFHHEGDIDE